MVWIRKVSRRQLEAVGRKGTLGEAGQLARAATIVVLALNPATIEVHAAMNVGRVPTAAMNVDHGPNHAILVAHTATTAVHDRTVAMIAVHDLSIATIVVPDRISEIAADRDEARNSVHPKTPAGGRGTTTGDDSMLSRQSGESDPLRIP